MIEKYNNKYRISSARLQGWDYGANAIYFVTICTANRAHYFGEIEDNTMQLNAAGMIAGQCWLDIPKYYPYIILDAHVVMPNHVHGIVIIDSKLNIHDDDDRKWKPGTLGVIINQYKRIVTINARKTEPHFSWQTRFHDHIIRNEKSFEKIQKYIQENPLRWVDDMFYGASNH